MTQWYGLMAPATLPQAALDRLAAEAVKAIRAPSSVARLAEDTAQAVGGTPAEFSAFIAAEQRRWKPVIARARIKPD
jgi:tripartite-type tricarboxylate transporter receptor subunit TctC